MVSVPMTLPRTINLAYDIQRRRRTYSPENMAESNKKSLTLPLYLDKHD